MLNPARPVVLALAGFAFAMLSFLAFTAGPTQSVAEAAGNSNSTAPRVYFPKRPYPKELDDFASRRGIFKVKLVGYQVTRWNTHSPPDGICSGETRGNGFERVVFRTPAKRMKLSAFGQRRLTSMILPGMKVRGQLTRKGTYDYTPLENPSPDCPYGDGGGDSEPVPPDCGTRKFKGVPMSLFALDGFFKLRSEAGLDHRPAFRKCPNLATAWPSIITERTNRKPIQTRFPGGLVFNRKFNRKTGAWSKVIVLARGVKKRRTFTDSSVVRLQWTLTLKRLR